MSELRWRQPTSAGIFWPRSSDFPNRIFLLISNCPVQGLEFCPNCWKQRVEICSNRATFREPVVLFRALKDSTEIYE